jgi:hypothetical protein
MARTEHERIKDRVRKLLNLGKGSEYEGEIKNALAFAAQLMQEHQLTEADVEKTEADLYSEMALKQIYSNATNLAQWESYLLHAITKTIGTIGHYRDVNGGRSCEVRNEAGLSAGRQASVIKFYGPQGDCELAARMFADLSLTIMTMARLKYRTVFKGEGRCYCEGFASELNDQAKRDQQRLSTEKTTALTVRSKQIAKRWLREEQGVRLRSSSRSNNGQYHSGAYHEGRADGAAHGMGGRPAQLGSTRQLP